MKWLSGFLFVMLLAPALASAQGVRMSADFLPLAVGNKWDYNLVNEEGKDIGHLEFDVAEHRIISGQSFYVISGFPFVENGGQIRLVRYDKQEHQFMRKLDEDEGPLFLSDGATTEVIDQDSTGLPMKFVLHSATIALTFQRGVGIVEARIQTGNGVQIAKVNGARVGQGVATGGSGAPITTATNQAEAGQAPPPPQAAKTAEQKAREQINSVGKITADNPVLLADVQELPAGHKFTMTVTNNSDKLLPFAFTTSQKFDFAVIDAVSGQEIWRLSRQTFPSAVKVSEAIGPRGAWSFEVTWNHRDNNFNPVSAGNYRLVGFVTTQPVLESEPVTFVIK